jgi:hypothetical protein
MSRINDSINMDLKEIRHVFYHLLEPTVTQRLIVDPCEKVNA